MNKVIKYKFNYLLSNKLITILTIILIIALNFNAIINSGVMFSGGADFNSTVKYALILNNYITVSSLHGLIFSIFLGSSIIGPDIQTGKMYVLLTSFPSRVKYYLGTFFAVLVYLLSIHYILLLNTFVLFLIFDIQFIPSDIYVCFKHIILNSIVVLTVTGFFSVFMKGFQSAVLGFIAYAYYNIYTFNEIPFINNSFIFDVTQYKNILCNLFPIIHVLAPSYTSDEAFVLYQIHPVISDVNIYQIIYAVLILSISCVFIKRKDL